MNRWTLDKRIRRRGPRGDRTHDQGIKSPEVVGAQRVRHDVWCPRFGLNPHWSQPCMCPASDAPTAPSSTETSDAQRISSTRAEAPYCCYWGELAERVGERCPAHNPDWGTRDRTPRQPESSTRAESIEELRAAAFESLTVEGHSARTEELCEAMRRAHAAVYCASARVPS